MNIFDINDTSFGLDKNDIDVKIEVGDSKQEDFYPQIKLMKWDNETNFSIRLIDDIGNANFYKDKNIVIWENHDKSVIARFYNIPDNEEIPDGGFEFEVEVKNPIDKIQFSMQSKGLKYLYQGELDENEIKDNCIRPENCIGSYAVYHKTKRNNVRGGKKYNTGKAFHIYRPFAIDADGQKIWCDLNIDEKNELMTIDIPKGAKFPLLIDPTVGNTTIGVSSHTLPYQGFFGTRINEDRCYLEDIAIYTHKNVTNYSILYGCTWRGDLLAWETSGHAETPIALTNTTPAWRYDSFREYEFVDYLNPFIDDGLGYFYAGAYNTDSSYTTTIYYDAGSVGDGYYHSSGKIYNNVLPSLSNGVSRLYSVYVTIAPRIYYRNSGSTQIPLQLFKETNSWWLSKKLAIHTYESIPESSDVLATHHIPLSTNFSHKYASDMRVRIDDITYVPIRERSVRLSSSYIYSGSGSPDMDNYEVDTSNPYYPSYNYEYPSNYFRTLIVVFFVLNGLSAVPSTPSGWTRQVSDIISSTRFLLYTKPVTLADENGGSYTWNFSGSPQGYAHVRGFHYVDFDNPVIDVDYQINASSTNVTAPTITPTRTYDYIFWFAGSAGQRDITDPTGFTSEKNSDGFTVGICSSRKEITSLDPTGPLVGTMPSAAQTLAGRFIIRRDI